VSCRTLEAVLISRLMCWKEESKRARDPFGRRVSLADGLLYGTIRAFGDLHATDAVGERGNLKKAPSINLCEPVIERKMKERSGEGKKKKMPLERRAREETRSCACDPTASVGDTRGRKGGEVQ